MGINQEKQAKIENKIQKNHEKYYGRIIKRTSKYIELN
jgi:hypothetical protein